MKLKVSVLVLLLLVACGTKRQVPAASAETPRKAIEILYVGVPQLSVYTQPNDVSPVITTYGYTETVSILARKGDWVEVRTVDGSGFAHANELINVGEVSKLKEATPRFMVPPVGVPKGGVRGEIAFEAKVNTDGVVVDVTTVKNTTRSEALATANAESLKNAKFFPMIQKGQHVAFTYQHHVYY
jgi:hypothetical protein